MSRIPLSLLPCAGCVAARGLGCYGDAEVVAVVVLAMGARER